LSFEPLKSGFQLSKVDKDSIFEKAGLREGDVVLSVNGNREIKKEDLVAVLGKEISDHPKSPNIEILRKDREEKTYQSHFLANQEK
jgi:type II secretory pathway component PulC